MTVQFDSLCFQVGQSCDPFRAIRGHDSFSADGYRFHIGMRRIIVKILPLSKIISDIGSFSAVRSATEAAASAANKNIGLILVIINSDFALSRATP